MTIDEQFAFDLMKEAVERMNEKIHEAYQRGYATGEEEAQGKIEALRQQEPVAWMTRFDDPERGSYGKPADTHLKRDEAERQVQRHIDKRLCKLRVEPLYTALRHCPIQPTCEALARSVLLDQGGTA
jgi:hypothetical protein